MRRILVLLAVVMAVMPVSAKLNRFLLRGWVEKQDYSKTDWQRSIVDSVYVDLVKNDTLSVNFKVLRGDDEQRLVTGGEVRLMVYDGPGKYTLMLNREGYEPMRRDFELKSESQDVYYLRSIVMEPRRQGMLRELEVVGTAIKMVMKGDTIVYDSSAFLLPEGSTLDALVHQLPGAQLAEDGSITVNGKKVKSLLLNGEDFFKGDPEVMLKNLPSYVVDKIKVYDKVADDDNVSLASHTISDSPDNENLVMDVTVKKEFQMATVLSIEGGYGPGIYTSKDPKRFDHRYLGRAFAVGFGKNYRFAAFGNVNNLKNTSKATASRKDWGSGWSQQGELQVAMGGFDIFYKPNDKIEAQADLQYSREDIEVRQLTATTRFFPTGNLYSRSRLEQDELRRHLIGGAAFKYSHDNIYTWIQASIDRFRSSATEYRYSADFSQNPSELTRGAAIDSLFRLKPGAEASDALQRIVTSANYQSYRGQSASAMYPDWLMLKLYAYSSWRPRSIRGKFGIDAQIDDRQEAVGDGRIIYQTLTDPTVNPARREQWTDADRRNTNARAGLNYDWGKKFLGETYAREVNLDFRAGWSVERQSDDKTMMSEALMAGFDPLERPLPSQTAPENLRPLIDPDNTYRQLFLNNRAQGQVVMSFRREILAPTDSGLNLQFTSWVNYEVMEHFRHLSFSKPDGLFDYRRNRVDPTHNFNTGVNISSNNNLRYFNMTVDYTYATSLLNMISLIPTVNSSDPFNVYVGPEEGARLNSPSSHRGYWGFNCYDKRSHINFNASVNGSYYENSMAQTAEFNPSTGVTTHTPVNVDGNWSLNANASLNVPFGPLECWNVIFSPNYNHQNNIDYVSTSGVPERSLVRSDNLGGNLSLSYKLKNGTKFTLGGNTAWQHASSPRADFSTISATNSSATALIDFYLPWGLQGNTSLSATFRRGYEDSSLNTTEWIWNLGLQKSLLKGAMTVKVIAVDLLGQLSSVSYSVNAQGRTEVWTNNLPRYAMLTLSYRFNFTPNSLK